MKFLRKPDVKSASGWRSDASVSNAVRDGLLTKPVQLGPRSVGWPDFEIEEINLARVAGKSNAEIKSLVIRLYRKRSELATA